ncbi:MAG TPA: SDR family oxidoreductase [Chthonomonadaceae bacterium]|nr:SDR family oxidoreductase [Chthonomonadaceae bacterium]
MTLNGQIALISGGLGDIGHAIAVELGRRGAHIALCDLHEPEKAWAVLEEIRQHGSRARYDRVDVADARAVRAWVQAVEGEFGVPTLIIPNAAIVTLADVLTVTPEQWSRELRVNLDGAFHLAQAGAQHLVQHGKPGRIVFVGSWAAHAPHLTIPAYCAAKAGVRMLCKCLALQLAPHHILVNEVAPGYVDAGLSGKIFTEFPERRSAAVRQVPTHELITPQEVALQVAHLCEPTTRHVTGSVLLMDGGLSLLSGGMAQEEEN